MNALLALFNNLHIEHPWLFNIICGLLSALIISLSVSAYKIVTRTPFRNFHTEHPWLFAITSSLIGSIIILLLTLSYNYLFPFAGHENQPLAEKRSQNTHQSAINTTEKVIPAGAEALGAIETSKPRKDKLATLVGSSNKGHIFSDVVNVVISGNSNKDIVIKECDYINLEGHSNVLYVMSCKKIQITGNNNTVFNVDGKIDKQIYGFGNVIKAITQEKFNKVALSF